MDDNKFIPGSHKPANERPGYQSESQRRQRKHNQALGDLQKAMPHAVSNSKPIDYDNYGLPTNIDSTTQQVQQALSDDEGEYLESQPVSQPVQRSAPTKAQMEARVQQAQRNQNEAQQAKGQQFFGQQTPPPQQQPQYAVEENLPENKKPKHPIIQKMLQRFGLKKTPRYNLEIYTEDKQQFVYTMTILPDELNTWALEEAKKHAVTSGESAVGVYFEHLVVCTAVVAIDNTPVWKIFEIQPQSWEAEDLVEDPLNLSLRIRKACGLQLAELLWSETRSITDKLSDFYQNEILTKNKLTSSFDAKNENTFRYVCVHDDCPGMEILEARYDQVGNELQYFCKLCATPMVKAADINKERSVPLV